MKEYKPKVIKGTKVIYDDKEYNNIISISRGYDYSNFSYLIKMAQSAVYM